MIKKLNQVSVAYSEFHVNVCYSPQRCVYNEIVSFFRQAVEGVLVPRFTKNFAVKQSFDQIAVAIFTGKIRSK